MKKLLLIGLLLTAPATPAAQEPSPTAPPPQADVVSLKVRLTLSRYQGDKRVSAAPYEMTVRSDGSRAQLRMGNEVPVPFVSTGTDPKKPDLPAGAMSFNYRPVGTNIDLTATPATEGRYKLDVLLEDSSVVLDKTEPPPMPALAGAPIFRSFRSTNTLLLRNGVSAEFTLATDRITGETLKVDVTLLTVTK
jgi:hypothetical protein